MSFSQWVFQTINTHFFSNEPRGLLRDDFFVQLMWKHFKEEVPPGIFEQAKEARKMNWVNLETLLRKRLKYIPEMYTTFSKFQNLNDTCTNVKFMKKIYMTKFWIFATFWCFGLSIFRSSSSLDVSLIDLRPFPDITQPDNEAFWILILTLRRCSHLHFLQC